MALTYISHPSFPLAHGLLDFWSVVDQKLYGKAHEELREQKLSLISRFVRVTMYNRELARVPSPIEPDPLLQRAIPGSLSNKYKRTRRT